MVVIVGVNGSGKSSTVKLFNRIYEPTTGEIFLDGRPISDYKLADLRRTMSILRQDHSPYPVNLRENIALGLPGRNVSTEEVHEAAKKGGAAKFIEKLDKGFDTVLVSDKLSDYYVKGDEGDEYLKSFLDNQNKCTDISGGESQRLSAYVHDSMLCFLVLVSLSCRSRTFLRLSGGDIRFLVADEPTSALDPEAEYDLFSQLREMRGTKTLVFITHRFGHLTRHADLILYVALLRLHRCHSDLRLIRCLKDGELVEQGTHDELVAKGGEYFRLHDVQARAFA